MWASVGYGGRRQRRNIKGCRKNGKPDKLPPKPVLLPKPRRPPPNAPSEKPVSPNECVVTNNNEVAINKRPSVKPNSVTETNKNILSSSDLTPPKERTNNVQTTHVENGPADVNSMDDQLYEPLRPRTESALSSSDDGYEDLPTVEKNKDSHFTAPRADIITPSLHHKTSGANGESTPSPPPKAGGMTGKPSPPVPRKISSTAGKNSPPTPHKISSTASKFSPPIPRKSSGIAAKTSPQSPRKPSDTRQTEASAESPSITENTNSAARTVDLHAAGDKSKPLPPKKPLPSLPKGMVPPGQKPPVSEVSSSKPPLPHKPPPDLASASKTDMPQPSVAALAQKLSTIPVFPFRDSNTGKAGGIFPSPGTSPRASPHSSPRPSPRNQPSSSSPEKSDSKLATGTAKPYEVGKPKLLPRPGASPQKPPSQPTSPRLGQETQKHPPVRPSPPSAEAVAKVRSRTLESLEDKESSSADDTIGEIDGPVRKSSLPERRKQRLATGRRLGIKLPSSKTTQANRRPPPLPPGAAPVTEKTPTLKVPPLPAVPRPRPASAYDHTQGVPVRPGVSKSVSLSDMPRVGSAEDQSEYAYAYEHTFLGASPPKRSLSACNPPSSEVEESDGTYVAPDESVVNEFMEDIHGKSSSMSYEVADEQSVAGFMDSLKKKQQTLNGMPAELSTDTESESSDSDGHEYIEPPIEESEEEEEEEHDDASSEHSFSSDSSHEYCVPPENISPTEPPPHRKDFDEEEGIYVEPIHKPADEVFSSDDDKDSVAEEPLYQVYTRCTLQRERNLSRQRLSSDMSDMSLNDEASLEELTKGTLKNMRMLWCELPEVIASGVLDIMKPDERKRQEAMFEVITSEASYLRSLNILMSHFINSDELSSGSSLCVLERGQSHVLFSNIHAIKSVSESFLQALRARQKDALVISSISDIILEYASKFFDVYVKYCSNQIYQDRALKNLRKSVRFLDAVSKLQSSKKAQGLTLQSFLVLPMQRITRLPLLVNAICHRCEAGSEEYMKTDRALAAINKIVNDCNEGARKMERMEEICVLQTQIEFRTKPLALATPARYLLRRGDLMQVVVEDSRNPLKRLRPKFKPVYMFLFNDLLLLAKKKSENRYVVLDYATRNMTQVDEPQDSDINVDHMFSLVLLENSESKTKEFLMAGNTETDKTRWMEAFKPPAAEQEGETVYASWDCPQVNALHNYTAQQPDELSLYEGDVINVLKKLPDGWYHGERLCDGTQGWFPANHTEEILNEHVRARNLRQRYRLLAASKHLIGGTLRI
ncbi:hypothetical protein ACROYT_G022522 [Oculina patagonica]